MSVSPRASLQGAMRCGARDSATMLLAGGECYCGEHVFGFGKALDGRVRICCSIGVDYYYDLGGSGLRFSLLYSRSSTGGC